MARHIDADKLIGHIKDLPTWFKEDGWWHSTKYPDGHFDCDDVINSIDNAPTADVAEVKYGEWIKHFDDLFPAESTQECSVCHEEEFITLCNDNYCPNCGAKMDGGKAE